MKRILFAAPVAFVLLLACGGSSHTGHTNPATSLQYTDPIGKAGEWTLVKDASSTATHLVLNVVGPSDGTKYRGVGFTLQADTDQVKFGRFKNAEGESVYGKDCGVFQDKTDAGEPIPVTIQMSAVREDKLMAGIFQKNDEHSYSATEAFWTTARDCKATVYQVAIDLDPALKAVPGPVPLAVLKARVLPEDLSTIAKRKIQDAVLKVGTLELK